MYRLFIRFKDRDWLYLIPLVLLSLAVRFRYFFVQLRSEQGLPTSPDSEWYLDYAHALMADFRIGLDMNDIMYAGYNLLLTLLLAIFKDPVAVVFIQVATAGLSVILVYKIARMLFNRTTAFIASVFYGYSWDITLWSTYILTDSFFISLLLTSVYLLLKSFESDKKRYKILFAASALYMFVFRPAGILTILFMLLYIWIRMDKRKLLRWIADRRTVVFSVLAAAVAVLGILLASGRLAPFLESLEENALKVLYNMYAHGWVYDKPSEHDYPFKADFTIDIANSAIVSFLVHNGDQIIGLYGKRIVAFLGRWVWETDLGSVHGVLRFVRYILPTVLFVLGTVAAIVAGTFRKASVLWLVTLAVFVFCVIFFIDGLYRYKAPSIPFIAIAAAYGADRIIRGLLVIAKKYTGMLLWNKEKY
ncbi:glycosyltransferase family 39 protein [Paenibacillus hodogayensis]|uniref:Glycosyltransferase family 39 protein n=1 Tax=Paenibacillus hodogayensis TaxID=279208 RepID=A0ABV5W8P6_9BACL